MKTTKVHFENDQGQPLAAKLEMPLDEKPHNYALFAHCFTCSKDLKAVANIARALTQEGFAVLRFDFTGLGQSAGDFADTNFSTNVSDLVTAARYLEQHYAAPTLLMGHSLGGAATLFAARQIESVQALATISAPFRPQHIAHLLEGGLEAIQSEGQARVSIGGRPFTIRKQFLEDLQSQTPEDLIRGLRKPLLVLHSPQDMFVDIGNAQEIYQAAFHPKSFISLDRADHLLSRAEDSRYVGTVIAGWARRYLTIPETSPIESNMEVATRTTGQKFTTEIKAGKHHLLSDEPEKVGGADLGPSPYDFVMSGLGACTSMTLRMYADHKQLPLHEVEVHLAHEKRYHDDQEASKGKGAKIDHITRVVQVAGDFGEEMLDRLLKIANKCPVHRTLESSGVHVDTRIEWLPREAPEQV